MFNPAQFYEAGRTKIGIAQIPLISAIGAQFVFSTRSKNAILKRNDGSAEYGFTPLKMKDYTDGTNLLNLGVVDGYSTNYTGNFTIKLLGGAKDVYSIATARDTIDANHRLNITDVETFFVQFPNLYSVALDANSQNNPAWQSIVKGDLSRFPNSVERVGVYNADFVNAAYDLVLNFSNYSATSQLKWFLFSANGGNIKLLGDLSKLPIYCNYLKLVTASAGSSITYTAGKVWASAFDTLYLPIALGVFENDNLLNDLKNSVTTAIGGKVIFLGNGYRSSASNDAVTYLTGLGFTISGVSVIVPKKILDLPFQNSFTDLTGLNTLVAGGSSNLPTFVSDGAGGYFANFNGSQSLKTSGNLPLADKITAVMDLKTTATTTQMILELSSNFDSNNAFGVLINYISTLNKLAISDHNGGYNIGYSVTSVNSGSGVRVSIIIDRSLSVAQNKISVGGISSYSQDGTYQTDLTGNFGSFPLYIGQRGGSSFGFVGQMKNLKIFNYPLTQTEINAL